MLGCVRISGIPTARTGDRCSTQLMRRRGPFCFYEFDLVWLDGTDLRERPLLERSRAMLSSYARQWTLVRWAGSKNQWTWPTTPSTRWYPVFMKLRRAAGAKKTYRKLPGTAHATRLLMFRSM
jgi:hypothetical protein